MRSDWDIIQADKFIDFNPKETIRKGELLKKVAMEQLQPYTRDISGYELTPFNGGSKFRNGDTLMARITPCLENGKIAQVNILENDEVGFGSTEFIVMREIPDVSDSDFIYYLVISPSWRNKAIKSMVGSSGRQRVQQSVLDSVELCVPSLPEQREIARTLRALDDKIANNANINHHLEQMAQAIFKSWFVGFEPFGGVMPDDWREGTFSEVISATLGGDWGKDTPTGNNTQEVYCIRGADIPDINVGNKGKMPIRFILPKNYITKQLAVGDIVIEISGGSPTQSTGRCALITQSLLDRYDRGMVCTNFCRAVKPLEGYSAFVYFYWKYLYDQSVMFSYENGTTGIKNLDITGFLENEPIIIPTVGVVAQFTEAVETFIDTIFANGLENEGLATTRDTLLPRLMSGELPVTNDERNKD
jgi:Restriction endonuclease S subunits